MKRELYGHNAVWIFRDEILSVFPADPKISKSRYFPEKSMDVYWWLLNLCGQSGDNIANLLKIGNVA